ncbi:two-component sensor histidine kinase [Actinocatenispora thailandica]|uniref:histidine kinase n=1 Tax=Actinocatenispora thailandica TaxID=227318 RepID=A0A7R7DUL6_9ACTN|nr:two-component sensor histidine kinase [Actinocatenispora thailandica]
MLGWIRRAFRLPLRSVAFDAFAAAIVAALAAVALLTHHWWSGLIGLGMAVTLLPRRRWSVPVFAVTCVFGLLQLIVAGRLQAYDLAVLLAMYSVVKYADRMGWAWLAAATVVVGCAVYGLTGQDGPPEAWYRRGGMLLILAIPVWLSGLVMRTRRLYVHSLEERARTAEQERDQRARLAVADERSRIARELHDVVAHSLAVMIAQADGASYALAGDPATARDAVRTVADTGRGALAEMRRLVAVLREHGVGDPAADRRTERLADLSGLLDGFQRAGLRVAVTTSGQPRPLPHGIELAGYRIVQEALTNVLKHAGAGTDTGVEISYRTESVTVTVVDGGSLDSAVPGPVPGGHGLLGMRERVGVYGGTFSAGPRRGAPGWRVAATLPVPPDVPAPAGTEDAGTEDADADADADDAGTAAGGADRHGTVGARPAAEGHGHR